MIKELNDITLVCVDTRQAEVALHALNQADTTLKFKKKILLSDKKPFNLPDDITYFNIKKISSLEEYSNFILHKLSDYIDTKYCITIHADGYICNPDKWDDIFLKYDYIGAPWNTSNHFIDQTNPNSRVGNGGFSLRSKILLDLCKELPLGGHEDTNICIQNRNFLENKGIKFAPLNIAAQFSTEQICYDLGHIDSDIKSFGFHGKAYTIKHKQLCKKIFFDFYAKDLIKMNEQRLLNFLHFEAGVSQTDYFLAHFAGNLELQQIPEEYINLLKFFKETKIEHYLELGVANGGSFFINSIFMQNGLKEAECVDCLAYTDSPVVKQTEAKITSKINKLNELFSDKQFKFTKSTTDDFFKFKCNKKYCCIFIDADHSYDGVMKDYKNSLNFIKKDGYLIFHDIANTGTGVAQCWSEIKHNHKIISEFIHPYINNCGIGIVQI